MAAKKNLLLLFISIILAVLAAECILRFAYRNTYEARYSSSYFVSRKNIYYLHEPIRRDSSFYISANEFRYPHITNEAGMIGKLLPKNKPENKIRIAVLGDSFTEGIGAPPDSSYPQQLQNIFDAAYPQKVEVLNAGLCGSDPVYEYMLLRDSIALYHPDLIIVNTLGGDLRDEETRGGFERFNKDGTVSYVKPPFFAPLFENSLLFRMILTKLFKYNYLMTRESKEAQRTESAIHAINEAIDSFALFSNTKKIPLLVVFTPGCEEFSTGKFELQKSFEHCKAKKINCLKLIDYYASHGITNDNVFQFYWKEDKHHNSIGYNLYAEGVYESLLKNFPELFAEKQN